MKNNVSFNGIMFLFIFVVCGWSFIFAQRAYFEEELDGHAWLFHSKNYKLGYIGGYNNAIRVSSLRTMLELNRGGLLPQSVSYDSIWNFSKKMARVIGVQGVSAERVVYELDRVYENLSYRSIPVHTLIPLIGKYIKGELNSREMRRELHAYRLEYRKVKHSQPETSEAFVNQPGSPEHSRYREDALQLLDIEEDSLGVGEEDFRWETFREELQAKQVPVSFVSYVHPGTGFKLFLPESWKVKEVSGKDHFLEVWSPRENLLDNYNNYILISHMERRSLSVRRLFSRYVSQLRSSLREFRITSGRNTFIGDKSSYIAVFSYLGGKSDSEKIRIKSCWVYNYKDLYVVNFIRKAESFGKYEKIFDKVIKSITF